MNIDVKTVPKGLMGWVDEKLTKKCGMAPKEYTRSTGSAVEVNCSRKINMFNAINAIVMKGKVLVGLSSLKGIINYYSGFVRIGVKGSRIRGFKLTDKRLKLY